MGGMNRMDVVETAELDLAAKVLLIRYKNCDKSPAGHLKPDNNANECVYCYRRLNYITPRIDRILKLRRNILGIHQSMDDSLIQQQIRIDIDNQKTSDFYSGLIEIMESLK